MNNFCCEPMELLIANPDCPLKYMSWTRDYILTVPQDYRKKDEVCVSFNISHCPRCGTKLPHSLAEEWSEIIEREYGITDDWDEEQLSRLPQEFKTDEWWKKRGL